MPLSPHDFLQHFYQFLTVSAASRSFTLSLLLIGLEALIEQIFSCPCSSTWNTLLIAFIFTGPALFIFALMFILLRPLKHGYCEEEDSPNDAKKLNSCFVAFLNCLIPPVMWVIILFLDGDYLACSLTTLEGMYVFDQELNRKLCQQSISKSEHDYQVYIGQSQFYGYLVLAGFSVVMVVIVGSYDCCKSGKCCRRTYQETQEDQRGVEEARPQGEAPGSGEQEEVQEGRQGVEIPLKTISSAPDMSSDNAGDNADSC